MSDDRVRHFHTKVAGISYRNSDGTSRQAIARRCAVWEKLNLFHGDENPHDSNAIQVLRENGQQLGFLPAYLAAEVAAGNAEGMRYAVFISDITGGREGSETTGINLLIVVAEPGVPEHEVIEYFNQHIEGATAHEPGKGGCGTGVAVMLAMFVAQALL
ncbi:MAG: HIRAN domain-containing protein [Phycisphaerales bacterium JB054]